MNTGKTFLRGDLGGRSGKSESVVKILMFQMAIRYPQ
jgi:hypothetical protein